MHVGIANPRWRGKCSRHSWRMRNLQFCVSGKRPIHQIPYHARFVLLIFCLISMATIFICGRLLVIYSCLTKLFYRLSDTSSNFYRKCVKKKRCKITEQDNKRKLQSDLENANCFAQSTYVATMVKLNFFITEYVMKASFLGLNFDSISFIFNVNFWRPHSKLSTWSSGGSGIWFWRWSMHLMDRQVLDMPLHFFWEQLKYMFALWLRQSRGNLATWYNQYGKITLTLW